MSRTCSQCGNNGHNCRTCADHGAAAAAGGDSGGIMLFGVRVTEATSSSSFRKSVSMNNLSQYDQAPPDSTAGDAGEDGYASDDVVHASGRSRERKRGVPWTEEEHKLFLLGLQKVGKGDWRGIARSFVKTRTPTQVASHAQKYFLRRTNHNRRRRRSSLFDITTDSNMESLMEEDEIHPKTVPLSPRKQLRLPISTFPAVSPISGDSSMENLTLGPTSQMTKIPSNKLNRPIPLPPSSKMAGLNLNQQSPSESLLLSLKLSTTSSEDQSQPPSTAVGHSSAMQGMGGGNFSGGGGGDSIISVA